MDEALPDSSNGQFDEGTVQSAHDSLQRQIGRGFNIDPRDLMPRNYLTIDTWLPAAVHNELVEDAEINSSSVVEDAGNEFRDVQASTPLTILGWRHVDMPSHDLIADFVGRIQDLSNTVICVEYPPSYQEAIDRFLATGVFREGDNSDLYPTIYDWVYTQLKYEETLPPEVRGTYFDGFSSHDSFGILELYRVLESARRTGMEVVAIDPVHEMESHERDGVMLEGIHQQLSRGKGVVAILGNLHVNYGGYDYKNEMYESVAALAQARYGPDAVSTWMVQGDNRNLGASEGEITQPVLYDAALKVVAYPPQSAVRITESTFARTPELNQAVGVDYYVPVP